MFDKEDYVSLEVAKLLEEKGYNGPCDSRYIVTEDGRCEFERSNTFDMKKVTDIGFKKYGNRYYSYLAPSLYESQKWLREKYNCYIQVTHEAYIPRVNNLVQILFYDPNSIECWSDKSSGQYGDNSEFDTYQEALNFGILEALKRI